MEEGVRRWVVDISKWDPHPSHFSFALSLLPSHEHSSVTRFVKMEDRKRALVSRMLQYVLVHDVLQIPFPDIVIKRTLEGKPYLDYYDKFDLRFPNFNFNVSHHGDYVAIASEPVCLVGVDIVSYDVPQGETTTEFIQFFSSYFSSLEWDNIVNSGTLNDVLTEFYRDQCWDVRGAEALGNLHQWAKKKQYNSGIGALKKHMLKL
uniref:holo-[acyl-carrier-protein] synthase n=1 Tax=Glycine max TaxID=3847 RepID=K7MAV8_SOYBN